MKPRPILVLGHHGQLAGEIAKAAARRDIDIVLAGRDTQDLIASPDPRTLLDQFQPRAVINAAAYSAVDAAESDEADATKLNGDVPGLFARACETRDLPFVHISTDYVFDGSKGAPYVESDATAPLNAYGRSKAAGDLAVSAGGGRWTILRTAWLFSASGNNFAKTMLRLAATRDEIGVVDDQLGTPTFAGDCAEAALLAVARLSEASGSLGLINVAGAEHGTWADLAEGVLLEAARRGRPTARVRRIPSAEYPTPSRRPADTRLDVTLAGDALGWSPRSWREGVAVTLGEL